MTGRSLKFLKKAPITSRLIWGLTVVVLLASVGYPFATLLCKSFIGDEGFTTGAYIRMLSDPHVFGDTFNTIKLGIASTLLAVAVGVPVAWLITRTNLPHRGLLRILVPLSFVMPPFVSAIAWIQLFSPATGYVNRIWRWFTGSTTPLANIYSFWGLVFVMGLHHYMYVYLTTSAALENMDPSLEESARISGAGVLRLTRTVTLPLIAPSITSGALLTFISVSSNFGIASLIGLQARYFVLTTRIWNRLLVPDFEGVTALSMILLVITVSALIAQRLPMRRKRFTTVTGKVVKPMIINLGRNRNLLFALAALFLVFIAVVPLAALILSSFIKSIGLSPLDIDSYTIQNYVDVLFRDRDTQMAIRNSVALALTSATLVVFFGALLAYIIMKTNLRGRLFLDWLSSIPYALPGTVVAVAMVFAYVRTPIYNTLWILLIAYFVRFMPFGVRAVTGSLLQVDNSLEEVARVSGASWFQTLKDILLPLIKPGLIAGWIMAFLPAMKELTLSIILYPPGQTTIGVHTFLLTSAGYYNWAYAMAVVVAFISLAGQLVVSRLAGGKLTM